MKNKDLFNLEAALEGVKNLKGIKFSLCVIKNKRAIAPLIEDFRKISPPMPQEYLDYETSRIELCKKYSKLKDDIPISINGNYVIDDNKIEGFKKDSEKLLKKHEKIIEKYTKEAEEFNKILEEHVILDLYKIKEDELPADITAEQLEAIYDYIVIKEKEDE